MPIGTNIFTPTDLTRDCFRCNPVWAPFHLLPASLSDLAPTPKRRPDGDRRRRRPGSGQSGDNGAEVRICRARQPTAAQFSIKALIVVSVVSQAVTKGTKPAVGAIRKIQAPATAATVLGGADKPPLAAQPGTRIVHGRRATGHDLLGNPARLRRQNDRLPGQNNSLGQAVSAEANTVSNLGAGQTGKLINPEVGGFRQPQKDWSNNEKAIRNQPDRSATRHENRITRKKRISQREKQLYGASQGMNQPPERTNQWPYY